MLVGALPPPTYFLLLCPHACLNSLPVSHVNEGAQGPSLRCVLTEYKERSWSLRGTVLVVAVLIGRLGQIIISPHFHVSPHDASDFNHRWPYYE